MQSASLASNPLRGDDSLGVKRMGVVVKRDRHGDPGSCMRATALMARRGRSACDSGRYMRNDGTQHTARPPMYSTWIPAGLMYVLYLD